MGKMVLRQSAKNKQKCFRWEEVRMGQESKSMEKRIGTKRKTAAQQELRSLIEKQQYCCALSGVALTPDVAELDHIHPVVLGGDHNIENLQVLHAVVNRMKGQMSNRDLITWCRIIAATADI
jgi:5-methylcytosine-specific restriction endonuclease McrA